MGAYTDLSLVFWNAIFYNEPDSQIALDAVTLKVRVSCTYSLVDFSPVFRTYWTLNGGNTPFCQVTYVHPLRRLQLRKYTPS
jgi:hypothetical protein